MRLMRTPDEFTGPVNLGNDSEFTIEQLAQLIISVINSRSKILYRPLPTDDPRQRKPATELARRILDWRAATPLHDGILETVKYFDRVRRR